jgi:arylsulfatase A
MANSVCTRLVTSGLVFLLLALSAASGHAAEVRPNIVFILADDLGVGDLGCYGQKKIKTPHIDRLAAEGMRFTRFYSGSPVCAPSRCTLMTGKHQGHAYIRDNRAVKPEGQEPIPADTVTLVRRMRDAGYASGAFGKWGLGPMESSGDPLSHGFQHFLGYNCQAHAHNFYPTWLWKNHARIPLAGNTGGVSGKTYSHDVIEQGALAFLRENRSRPFFLYLPFTIPHLALQVPEDSLAEYEGKFEEQPYTGTRYQPHPQPKAAYAAMITRLDRTVGRVIDLLAELKLSENTLICFTSDNGAGEDGFAGLHTAFFKSMGELRSWKGSMYEGGIRTPFIARWPGKIRPGSTSDLPAAFYDVLPTMCDVAGLAPPEQTDGFSLKPTLLGSGKQEKHEYLYCEFPGYGGWQAVWLDNWKGLRKGLQKGLSKIELYDLGFDPSEQENVAAMRPELVERIAAIMAKEHQPSPLFPIKGLDAASPR